MLGRWDESEGSYPAGTRVRVGCVLDQWEAAGIGR